MNFFAWAGLINAVTCLSAGLFVWSRPHRDARRITFILFMASVGTWGFFYFLWQLATDEASALFFARGLCAGAFFAPVTHLHHVATLVNATSWKLTKRLIRLGYAIALGLLVFNGTPLVVREVAPRMFFPYWPLGGPLWHIFTACYLVYWCFTIRLIWYGLVHSNGTIRNQFRFLMGSTLIAFTGGSTNFLLWYNIPIPPYGTILVPIYVVTAALTVIRYQFLDIRIVIQRSLVYSLLIACITATYLVMVLIMEHWFQGFFGYRSIVATLLVAFLIALGFNPLRERIQTLVDRALFQATPAELAVQREQLLSEVRKGEQQKAVATLAAGLAHEIRNPLASIKTFTEYLERQHADPAFRAKFQKIVGGEVERINRIVQQLLEFAKPMPPKLQPIELTRVVEETLELLNNELIQRHVEVKRSYQARPTILGDPQQLKQCLLNLVLNSVQAMTPPPTRQPKAGSIPRDGGETSSGMERLPLANPVGGGVNGHGCLTLETRIKGSELLLVLGDNGVGIAPEALPHVFDPFFTTKETGTGLGLAVVQGIIKEHGGRIAITSRVGQGTVVELSLPIASS